MKQMLFSSMIAAALACALPAPAVYAAGKAPKGATAKCADGTYSTAKNKQGACSAHGGVAEWIAAPAPAATSPKAEPREQSRDTRDTPKDTPKDTRPTAKAPARAGNPTAQCNDGTYSYAVHHQGACSGHQGVKTWFD